MTFQLLPADAATLATPLLVVFAVDTAQDVKGAAATPSLLCTNPAVAAATARVLASGEFKATFGEHLPLHLPPGLAAERILLIGAGRAAEFTPARLRRAAGAAVRFAKDKGIRSLAILAPDNHTSTELDASAAAAAIAEGAILADFDSDLYKSKRPDRSVSSVNLVVAESTASDTSLSDAAERGRIVAESQNFARALVLEPGNVLTPEEFGRRAASMAAGVGLTCQVHGADFLREHKMNAFLAVAQGSAQPPALIELHYEPAGTPAPDAPVLALVGKGITFDTGGISIKPADGMEKMKYDMAGAAAMLGAMRAVALLKPAVRVLCLVCAAENMPSGAAYRPGDVVTAMSGTTIEVMNTDAEGRMVLADGLHYAKTLGATHLIDAATLTGACVVALGRLNAGLFSNHEDTCSRFATAAEQAGESFWRLPCTDEYRDQIKSSIADIQNTGIDRWGGAITAAMFLKEFAGDTPWIHLDIAGQAWIDEVRPDLAKGPSGVGVRSVLLWVRSYERLLA